MIVTAWNNGKHKRSGVGYGLKIKEKDRDKYFIRGWGYVIIELENYPIPAVANIDKNSFWDNRCRELITKEIGAWLIKNDQAPWKKGYPPKLILEPIEENKFRLLLPF